MVRINTSCFSHQWDGLQSFIINFMRYFIKLKTHVEPYVTNAIEDLITNEQLMLKYTEFIFSKSMYFGVNKIYYHRLYRPSVVMDK